MEHFGGVFPSELNPASPAASPTIRNQNQGVCDGPGAPPSIPSELQERPLQPQNTWVLSEEGRREAAPWILVPEEQCWELLLSFASTAELSSKPQKQEGTSQSSCSSHLLPPPRLCHHSRYLNPRENQVVIMSLQHIPSAEPFQTAITGIKKHMKNQISRDGELHWADTAQTWLFVAPGGALRAL